VTKQQQRDVDVDASTSRRAGATGATTGAETNMRENTRGNM
jgi:hypothetical protein